MTAEPGSIPTAPEPTLRLAFDAAALRSNWQVMDRLSGSAATGAAVKADAYGVGVERVMPELIAAGCRDFFVAHWSEVAPVMAAAPPDSISVLHGPISDDDVGFARACGVRPVINSIEQATRWNAAGGGPCDLMVDTGMNRLGIRPEHLGDPAIAGLQVDTLLSHLACADEDSAMNARQLARFSAIRGQIDHRLASLANSAGIALGREYHFDLTRPGLALYGGVPAQALSGQISQVVTPEAAILQLRTVPAGESVGYGATFVAKTDTPIAVVSLGYADGYLRAWSACGTFLGPENQALPVIGRVSMDMAAIDVSAAPSLREGDWLRVSYSLPEASAITGLTQYELLTLAGPRLRG